MTKQTKAKISLGKRPEHFAPITVDVVAPDGAELCIPGVVYRYRTRKEFAQLMAETFEPRTGELPRTEAGQIDFVAMSNGACADEAGYLTKILSGWGLDVEITRENLDQLANELPGAVVALKQAYAAAVNEGRLGN